MTHGQHPDVGAGVRRLPIFIFYTSYERQPHTHQLIAEGTAGYLNGWKITNPFKRDDEARCLYTEDLPTLTLTNIISTPPPSKYPVCMHVFVVRSGLVIALFVHWEHELCQSPARKEVRFRKTPLPVVSFLCIKYFDCTLGGRPAWHLVTCPGLAFVRTRSPRH